MEGQSGGGSGFYKTNKRRCSDLRPVRGGSLYCRGMRRGELPEPSEGVVTGTDLSHRRDAPL